jgi:hypothetical protein
MGVEASRKGQTEGEGDGGRMVRVDCSVGRVVKEEGSEGSAGLRKGVGDGCEGTKAACGDDGEGGGEPAAAAAKRLRSCAVQRFIASMMAQGQFSVGWLRRMQNKEFVKQALARGGIVVAPKPNGLHIREMFDRSFMVPGATELPPGTHGLKIAGMMEGHVPSCSLCLSASADKGEIAVHRECYFHEMVELVRCGWDPPIPREVIEQYDCSTGNKDSFKYAESFDEQLQKLMTATEHAGPVLVPYEGPAEGLTINRLGLNVKSTDIVGAKVQVGIDASRGQAEL